jgi:hypothetical protein
MKKYYDKKYNLNYLQNKPERIWWEIVAGPPGAKLSILQEYDLIFDDIDLRIRKLEV